MFFVALFSFDHATLCLFGDLQQVSDMEKCFQAHDEGNFVLTGFSVYVCFLVVWFSANGQQIGDFLVLHLQACVEAVHCYTFGSTIVSALEKLYINY